MLILTRRVGEKLMIGDDVVLEVLGVKGNQIRVGIKAPKNVSVHREEIYNKNKWLPILEKLASDANKNCGAIHDVYQQLFSKNVDDAITSLSGSTREQVIELARDFNYLTPEEIAEQIQHNEKNNFCSHGLEPRCCPLGCGDL